MAAVKQDSRQSSAQNLWIEEKAGRAGFSGGQAFAQGLNLKPYRLTQLYRAATKELLEDVLDVTVLPKALRNELWERRFRFDSLSPVLVQRSHDAQTTKGLFRLSDGAQVETVLMTHYANRNTVCISSQAGCAFKCAFCSTGQAGFTRALGADEIFDQARYFSRSLAQQQKRLTNVVFMGMGEPFHNYDAVMGAVALLNDPQGFGLGHRHITISTVGLVPEIQRFTDEGIQVNLAISLHAPDDQTRSSIMPVNRRYPVADLMAACEQYVRKTNRKVFFEYVMLDGINDSDFHARELIRLMAGRLFHVNLIPYNATPDGAFTGSPEARIRVFAALLQRVGIPATVRQNMGRDIAAACGQLRADTQPKAHKATA
ncbi:MAG: 23S rRNA (adenine(2503)-C(2))-methyltransferase RlmN [Candidatus Eremiobacteraeota bacterium]|nr:23S rRNA (adenine(2503)-C(2))-methyltransferase RlmN [Candidatus Eremiobacteraeota bacterium]